MSQEAELIFEYPAKVASMLLQNEADIGLVPVAVIPHIRESYIISDYCIAAVNDVASVCLFSDVPLEEIKAVFLDYQSNTSVALLRILLKHHWKISPQVLAAYPGYEENINNTTAGLVIGDRALLQRKKSKYIYDLAEGWQEMTNLPFVFAAWVANKRLSPWFIELFNKTTGMGLQHLEEIVAQNVFQHYDLYKYYTANISYHLDDRKKEGLKLFLKMLSANE